MHRNPNPAAGLVLSCTFASLAGVAAAGCGGAPERTMAISFASRELLENADQLAIYFYRDITCEAVRAQTPQRPPSILGPYLARLDEAGRQNGVTFRLEEVPAGKYVVFVDAVDDSGTLVGFGCSAEQEVYEGEISRITVVINQQSG